MSKKAIPYIILVILAVAVIAIKQFSGGKKQETRSETSRQKRSSESNIINRNRGFDRRISFLRYTEHAKCRMDCREISQSEVEEIMQNGKINYNKSNIKDARCPTYAMEGITKDNQRVRIVYGQCDDFTNVVAVIDLDREYSCSCPGDDKKYEN